MKILIDMNLSPEWCSVLAKHGFPSIHWSEVGEPGASDAAIMAYAREHGYVVLTHDLDLGAILAATQAAGPSVIQMRTQDVLPSAAEAVLTAVLKRHEADLTAGALVVVDERKARVRILPLFQS